MRYFIIGLEFTNPHTSQEAQVWLWQHLPNHEGMRKEKVHHIFVKSLESILGFTNHWRKVGEKDG